jgi:outer membrane receptor protein involved in Fe transport
MQSESNVHVGPSAIFQGNGVTSSGGFLVNCDNPLLSAQQQTLLAQQCDGPEVDGHPTADMYFGRRNIEGGPRNSFYDHTNYRVVFGARGDLTGSWRYDIYGSFYKTTLNARVENYLSLQRIQDALLVGGTAAHPVCLSGNAGCIPYNIFSDGGVSTADASSLTILGTQSGSTTEKIIEGTITGDLGDYGIKSPWATDGVGVAFGFTTRRDHLTYAPDAASESGDLSGSGGASVKINNALGVAELFGEARVPLINDMPFVQELLLETGYRWSDYSTGIHTNTYKVGLQWQPVEDIRFRGSFNQAVRAPNILELYTPQSVTNTSDVPEDPCAIGALHPATQAQCANTGVTAGQYLHIPQCPANQCAVFTGGNTNLKEETAKTLTLGFTTRPSFLPGFTGSIDYYRIRIDDIIGTIPLDIILANCLETGNPAYCSQVVRNPVNGILFGTTAGAGGYINGTNVNVASTTNEGFDFQASYRLPLDTWGMDRYGGVSLAFSGSLLTKQANVPVPGLPAYDCAGYFGPTCGSVYPKWRHSLRVNWKMPMVDATLSGTWRYWGDVTYENLSSDVGLNAAPDLFIRKMDAVNYFDLSGLWNVNDNFSLRGGVNNVFDQDPPLVPNAIVGGALPNAYPLYDLLGRKFFMGITARF